MTVGQRRDVVMKLLQSNVVPGCLQLAGELGCRDLTHDVAGEVHLPDRDDCVRRSHSALEREAAAFTDGDQEMSIGKKFDTLNVVGRGGAWKYVGPEDISLQIGDDNSPRATGKS